MDKNYVTIHNDALLACEDITLYADWKKDNTFKVTFDSKGGSVVEPLIVECGQTLKLPNNPTKEGYTFGHWEDKWGTAILEDALLSCDDISLSAVWQ